MSEITIHLHCDQAGTHWIAGISTGDLSGGWQPTTEAALVALASKMREDYKDLGQRRNDSLTDVEWERYRWLAGVLS